MKPKLFLRLGLLLVPLIALPALADDDHGDDHERARRALQQGLISPLSEITAALQRQMPGEIIEVELETEDDGSFRYEFKLVTPAGKVQEVEVDAKTGTILEIEDDD